MLDDRKHHIRYEYMRLKETNLKGEHLIKRNTHSVSVMIYLRLLRNLDKRT